MPPTDPEQLLRRALDAEHPIDAVAAAARLGNELERVLEEQVAAAVQGGASWQQIADVLGVTRQAVHKKYASKLRRAERQTQAVEGRRLVVTLEARASVRAAREEAARLQHAEVGTEHLLLGVLREHGIAATALAANGVSLRRARRECARLFPTSGSPVPSPVPISRAGKSALEQSLREAATLWSGKLDVEHVLLAVLRQDRGAVEVLDAVGADRDAVERTVQELVAEAEPAAV